MAYVVNRLRYQRKGFRARMSGGWFVLDAVTLRPVSGPFRNKADADRTRDQLKGDSMTDREHKDKASKKELDDAKSETEQSAESKTVSGDGTGDALPEVDSTKQRTAGGKSGDE